MPALKPTEFTCEITWLGRVADRGAALASEPLEAVELGWAGIEGEEHGGVTRESCSRVKSQHPRGTEIRNVRQLSIVSEEDLALIAAEMGIERLAPGLLGASMAVRGIADFTHLPPSSRLQGESGATLVIDMENRPCVLPGPGIEAEHPGKGKLFKPAAEGRRGVTAWVERPGALRIGDRLRLHVPDQPVWSQLQIARRLRG
ncbi:MOSC domain-containing protein [Rhodalgimonas zhirmunskyi]|uniref:MOSC domain-containing protein n=1 Tax=Rhodalgimonas zhirmunskyi TaxID=2964767 RepID=A0AAJ1U528_9RHOB|nr:MOSC domain-containing protein [Rhodoalgimonas zhirmunskyi]MDQ2093790.1 MOSC domain-containing protein [Rhodoalgimonas zhirmunskyi]